jgi:putative ABC transport system ATP-binding protein
MNGNLSENIIELKNVKKIYRMGRERICAVDNVSFAIKKGEFCCLYGVSGSGKSTLLNLMAGIEKITSGQILVKGKVVNRMSEKSLAKFRQNNIGFVFQSYNLMNTMTALENVEMPLIFKHVRPRKRKRMAKDMLIKVGLAKRLRHKPKEMSGGQQQRVGIARAFVSNPEIVFADEPTGNLDSKTSKEVMDLIRDMAKTNHQTIVMVTHDRHLAEYADRIIHIFDGMIEEIEIVKNDDVTAEKAVSEAIPVAETTAGPQTEPDINPAADIEFAADVS